MILFSIFITLVFILATILAVCGFGLIAIFGDLIVFVLLMWFILKFIFGKKKD